VTERAVIISRGWGLDFDLPAAEAALVPAHRAARATSDAEPEFFTETEAKKNRLLGFRIF